MVGTAVKVVLLPAQMDKDAVDMFTAGVTIVVVVMDNALLVSTGVLAHDALLVISAITISPFAIAVVVKLALLVPAFVPFIFH